MPDLKVTDTEIVRDIPGNPPEKGGPAKVLKLTLEGDERQPQLFATAKTEIPKVVSDADIKWNEQWNRYDLVTKKGGAGGGGGWKRSPGETKAIQRQHSQEQALRREANMIAAGGRPYNETQLRSVINFFEQDIGSKDRSISWDGFSDDVPGDDSDLPWSGPSEEELREKS